jgi:hypothetical protein
MSREEAHRDLGRFASKLGLDSAEDLVEYIQRTPYDEFIDVLAASNSILRSLSNWTRNIFSGNMTVSGVETQLVRPDNAAELFETFYTEMQQEISPSSKDEWAVKLYVALWRAHLFKDGNGRLSRNAYSFLRAGTLASENTWSGRTADIRNFEYRITLGSYEELLIDLGIQTDSYDEILGTFTARPEEGVADLHVALWRFIAAKRVLQRHDEDTDETNIIYGEWSKQRIEDIQQEYQEVLKDLFWACISVAEDYPEWSKEALDQAIR